MSVDPFEITQQEPNAPPPLYSGSASQPSSRFLIVTGGLSQLGAMSLIGYAWLATDKIPVAWHAIVSLIAVMMPTNSLTDLARGVIRAWARKK